MMMVRLRTLEAMALLLAARFLVRFVPLHRWSGLLGKPAPYLRRAEDFSASELERETVRKCIASVRRATFRLPNSLCLPQAIGLHWMLGRRGIGSTVIVGIRPAEQRGSMHDLHAWTEWRGQTILGDSGGNHASLLQFVG